MLNELFRGLMNATPVTPELDTSGSQGLNDQALALLAQAGGMPQVAAPKAPNLESIGLALLPALFGAGTNYLGGLGSGYMRGQQQEITRQNQNRTETMNNLIRQAQTLGGQADDMRQVELAQYNQGNMNARNNMDNFRSTMNTLANNQTRKDIATDKNKLTMQGMDRKAGMDAVKSAREALKTFVDSYGFDANAEKLRNLSVEALKQKFPDMAKFIDSMVPMYPVGFKPKSVKEMEMRKQSQTLAARREARAAWGQYLKEASRTGEITEETRGLAATDRKDFAAMFGVDERMLPLPTVGKSWQMVQAENNFGLRKDEYDLNKTLKEEDFNLRKAKFTDEQINKRMEKEFDAWKDKYDKVTKDAANVEERINALKMEQDKAEDQDTIDRLGKQIDSLKVLLSGVGEIGRKLAERDKEEQAIIAKYEKMLENNNPTEAANPGKKEQLPDVRKGGGSPRGNIGFGSQNEGGKSAPKKPKAAQGKQPAKQPAKQAPKPKNSPSSKVKSNGVSFTPPK